jgi:hypothetical protein
MLARVADLQKSVLLNRIDEVAQRMDVLYAELVATADVPPQEPQP